MDVTAVCERSGDWWAVSVPEVPGAFTQAKRLDQVSAMVADAVSLLADVPANSVHVNLQPHVPGTQDWMMALEESRRLEAEAKELQEKAGNSRRGVMQALMAAGLSSRDVGKLTGVSHQRVSQIVTSVVEKGPREKSVGHRTKAGAVAAAEEAVAEGRDIEKVVKRRRASR